MKLFAPIQACRNTLFRFRASGRGVLLLGAVAVLSQACSTTRVWHGRTPDRSRLIEVLEVNERQFIRVDGVEGPRFDAVPAVAIAFSEDGKHLAYAAQNGSHWSVVVDGARSERWDGIGGVVLGPDGAHVVFSALRGKQWFVVRDGVAGPGFDSLFEGTTLLCPDGQRLAYVGEEAEHSRAVIDGKSGPLVAAIGELAFSPDSAHVAYVARDAVAAWVVRDGVEGPRYDTVRGLAQANGDHFAFVGRRGAERFAVIDGQEDPPHRGVDTPVFSPDGARVAYVARDTGKSMVLVDGAPGPDFDAIEAATLAFSPDGNHLAYVARRGAQRLVVRDGIEGPSFDRVTGLIQVGGDRWGYFGSLRTGVAPVIGGEPRELETWAGDLALSSDGRRFAFLVRRGDHFAVVHDAGVATFDLVVEGSLTFSTDGTRWGCLAGHPTQKKLFVAIEGAEPAPFDSDELAGVAADRPNGNPELIRRWVRAEVERAPPRSARD